MKISWNANTWTLVVLMGILLVAGADIGRRWLGGKAAEATEVELPKPKEALMEPAFKVGDKAPDFVLPDSKGKAHSLSSLVDRETLLCFTCGCSSCENLQGYMKRLFDKMDRTPPKVVSVSTQDRNYEPRYIEKTGLKHTILYEEKSRKNPEVEKYKGHPCPRVFALKPDRTVTWYSMSMAVTSMVEPIADEVAQHLGFRTISEKDNKKPLAPPFSAEADELMAPIKGGNIPPMPSQAPAAEKPADESNLPPYARTKSPY